MSVREKQQEMAEPRQFLLPAHQMQFYNDTDRIYIIN